MRDMNVESQKGNDYHFQRRANGLRPDVGHYFLCHEGLDGIADLHVIEVLNADTAFVAFCDFGRVFLESL